MRSLRRLLLAGLVAAYPGVTGYGGPNSFHVATR